MAIKRGVSLYSYQQTQFFKQLDWKGQIREVRNITRFLPRSFCMTSGVIWPAII